MRANSTIQLENQVPPAATAGKTISDGRITITVEQVPDKLTETPQLGSDEVVVLNSSDIEPPTAT